MKYKYGILAIVLGFCITLSGCLFDKPIDDGIDTVTEALSGRNIEAIYPLLSSDSQSIYSKEALTSELANLDSRLKTIDAKLSKVDFDKENSDDMTRLYHAMFTLNTAYGEVEGPVDIKLTKVVGKTQNVNGEQKDIWKFDWNRSYVFPGLKDGDELGFTVVPANRGMLLDRDGKVLAKDVAPGKRVYPLGNLTSDAVGFVRMATENDVAEYKAEHPNLETKLQVGMNLGRLGLEKAYQERLCGENGLKVYLKAQPENILLKGEPKNGEDIKTTLDLKVQQALFNQVSGEYGAGTAMNPQNGEVLALVCSPSLNVDIWSDAAMSAEQWNNLKAQSQTPYEGLFSQTFLPGSTQKLLTSIIGLNHGVITTADNSGYNISGSRWQPDSSWGGYTVHRVTPIDGFITLKTALIHSDNIFFSKVALDVGMETYIQALQNLGIGQEVPSDLKIYKSRISNSGTLTGPIALVDTAYGQAQNLIAPLQMNMYYSALLNGGDVLIPQTSLGAEKKVWKGKVTSQDNINYINLALEQAVNVVHPNARRSFARSAGKTGTAEVGADGSVNLGWFCGFDLNNPYLCTCIMINYVENRGGSDVNTGKFGNMLDELYVNGQKYVPSGVVLPQENAENNANATQAKG